LVAELAEILHDALQGSLSIDSAMEHTETYVVGQLSFSGRPTPTPDMKWHVSLLLVVGCHALLGVGY
jgi:hypothetical protein